MVRTNEEVRKAVNHWLGSAVLKTRYELQIRTLGPLEAMDEPLADAIEGLPIDVVDEGHGPGHDSSGREKQTPIRISWSGDRWHQG